MQPDTLIMSSKMKNRYIKALTPEFDKVEQVLYYIGENLKNIKIEDIEIGTVVDKKISVIIWFSGKDNDWENYFSKLQELTKELGIMFPKFDFAFYNK